jgi:hypothetical protein
MSGDKMVAKITSNSPIRFRAPVPMNHSGMDSGILGFHLGPGPGARGRIQLSHYGSHHLCTLIPENISDSVEGMMQDIGSRRPKEKGIRVHF